VSLTPDETYDAAVTAAVPALAAGLAALFAVFVPLHLLMLDGSLRVVMASLAAGSALLLGGFGYAVYRRPLPDHLAQPATAGLVLVAGANAIVHLVLSG